MTDHPKPPTMSPVESSNIESVGHDGAHGWIRFKSGGLYRYENAPAKVWDGFKDAESPGGYFTAAIAGRYQHLKVQ